MKHQIILILALLLVTAGCGPAPTGVGAEIVSQAIKTQSATAEATVGGFISTKTVVDSRSGIAFDYPVNWTLLEPSADDGVIYTYSVASYDLSNPSSASQNGLPSGQTKIDISFYGADETPDSAAVPYKPTLTAAWQLLRRKKHAQLLMVHRPITM